MTGRLVKLRIDRTRGYLEAARVALDEGRLSHAIAALALGLEMTVEAMEFAHDDVLLEQAES